MHSTASVTGTDSKLIKDLVQELQYQRHQSGASNIADLSLTLQLLRTCCATTLSACLTAAILSSYASPQPCSGST